jgi:hypothetical protein
VVVAVAKLGGSSGRVAKRVAIAGCHNPTPFYTLQEQLAWPTIALVFFTQTLLLRGTP